MLLVILELITQSKQMQIFGLHTDICTDYVLTLKDLGGDEIYVTDTIVNL